MPAGADTSAIYSAYTTTFGSRVGQSIEHRADAGVPPYGDQNITRAMVDRPVVASAGGMFLAGRALGPIDRITRAAAAIGAEDLSRRLNCRGRDEVGRLAATFDRMLDRLDQTFVGSGSSLPMPPTSCARR